MKARRGSALLLALFTILFLELVVLSVLHASTLQRRIADNGVTQLRLRLAAEAAIAATLEHWPPPLDTIIDPVPGAVFDVSPPFLHAQFDVTLTARALAGGHWQVTATAAVPGSGVRARHSLLLEPPLIPGWLLASGLALVGTPELTEGALVSEPQACGILPVPAVSVRTTEGHPIGGTVGGAVLLDPRLPDFAARVIARLNESPPGGAGVLHHDDIVIGPEEHRTGLLVTPGKVVIQAGGSFTGAILASGGAAISGVFHPAPCVALAAVAAWAFARPLENRSVVPAF